MKIMNSGESNLDARGTNDQQALQQVEMQIQVITLLLNELINEFERKAKIKDYILKIKNIDNRKSGVKDGKRYLSN